MTRQATKTRKVYDAIRQKIESGVYYPGYRLLPVREMAESLNVGIVTVRTAMQWLEKENLITRKRAQGTFVLDPQKAPKRCKRFLAIYPFDRDPIENPMSHILPVIERHCERLDIQLDKLPMEMLPTVLRGGGNQIREDNYDGIIIHIRQVDGNEPEIKFIKSLNIPIILPRTNPGFPMPAGIAGFYVDEHGAWEQAVVHLCEQGYKCIATIGRNEPYQGNKVYRSWSHKDYLQLLKDHGASPDPKLILNADIHDDTVLKDEFERIWQSPNKPDAILCNSDFMAMKIYDICHHRNIQIPQDLAVMGFCGYPGIRFLNPPLSTIDLRYAEIGRQVVMKLLSADKWFKPYQSCYHWKTPYQLIASDSTNPDGPASEIDAIDQHLIQTTS